MTDRNQQPLTVGELAGNFRNASESLVRFELTERSGVTTVRVIHSGLTTESARAQHRGWPDILAWLKAYAENSRGS